MRPLNRRGFTIMELLVAIVVFAVVATAIQQTVVMSQRATGAQVQRMSVQQSVRAVGFYLSRVVRELDASDGDIAQAGDTELRIRSMRWASVLCTPPIAVGTNVGFVIRNSLFAGLRMPDENLDSLLIFREFDPTIRGDDGWIVGEIVSSTAGNCPDGADGRTVVADIDPASGGNGAALLGVTAGSPVRGFQVEELSLYHGGGNKYWLGHRTADKAGVWTDLRPLVGPLSSDGLSLAYFDADGATTAVLTDIESVGLVVRGQSNARVRVGNRSPAYIRDSLVTRIALRNNVRF